MVTCLRCSIFGRCCLSHTAPKLLQNNQADRRKKILLPKRTCPQIHEGAQESLWSSWVCVPHQESPLLVKNKEKRVYMHNLVQYSRDIVLCISRPADWLLWEHLQDRYMLILTVCTIYLTREQSKAKDNMWNKLHFVYNKWCFHRKNVQIFYSY